MMRKLYPIMIMLIYFLGLAGCSGTDSTETTDGPARISDSTAEITEDAAETPDNAAGVSASYESTETEASVSVYGGTMKQREWMQMYFKKLNLAGIEVDRERQEEIMNNICQMPEDMLNDMDQTRILGLMLDYLGSPFLNDKQEVPIYAFDPEIINTDTMYTDFLNNINRLTDGELEIEVLDEDLSSVNYDAGNGTQVIHFKLLGEEYHFEAKVYYDWFDSAIINYLNEIFEEHNRDKFFYCTSDMGGCCILFYNTEEWAEQYNKLFPELWIGKEVD